jgi:hypothetical protein
MTDDEILTQKDLLFRLQTGWDTFNSYINTLTDAQMTQKTDAAGWTVKDHLMHLAVWEDGVTAALDGKDRREAMGIDEATWESDDYDAINDIIYKRYQHLPLQEVRNALQDAQDRMVAKLQSLTDEDLRRPRRDFLPLSTSEEPIINWVIGNSYEHYAEHQPWIAAIVG